jgi:hypothetical protein
MVFLLHSILYTIFSGAKKLTGRVRNRHAHLFLSEHNIFQKTDSGNHWCTLYLAIAQIPALTLCVLLAVSLRGGISHNADFCGVIMLKEQGSIEGMRHKILGWGVSYKFYHQRGVSCIISDTNN